MVIETDEIAAAALEKIFFGDAEAKLVFVDDFKAALEIVNGNPANKEVFEKFNAGFEVAKKEFQVAATQEATVKAAHDNCREILEKYQGKLDALKKPRPQSKKRDPAHHHFEQGS